MKELYTNIYQPINDKWQGGAATVFKEVNKRQPSHINTKSSLKNSHIIHTDNWIQGFLAKLIKPKAKFFLSLHGLAPENKQVYYQGKILTKKADRITTISNFAAQQIKKAYNVNCEVIYNGVDAEFFKPENHDNLSPTILFVGRLISWKRPQWISQIAKRFPEYTFIIHGKGQQLIPQTRNVKVSYDYLTIEQLAKLYANADIFLYPAIDWAALVVFEAMASGLPVIGNSVGGQAELIKHEVNGFLTSNLDKMCDYIQYLVEDKKAQRNIGEEARKTMLNYSWTQTAAQYTKIYEEMANEVAA